MTTLPRLTEREFMDQVTQLAELRGWSWAHFRPAQTAKGWRTPVSGPLGKGWPDLILARGQELLAVELKAEDKHPTPEQQHVLEVLDEAGAATCIWWPSDWPEIERVLR